MPWFISTKLDCQHLSWAVVNYYYDGPKYEKKISHLDIYTIILRGVT